MDGILNRIIQIQKEVSPKSRRAFELSIGKTSGYLNNMRVKNSVPNGNVLSTIIETYPEFSALWLLTGRGEKVQINISESEENLVNFQ